MLYTSYLDKLDELPDNSIKIIVMRYYPNDINILKYNKLYFDNTLAPSKEILDEYNVSNRMIDDWHKFKSKFNEELKTRKDLIYSINKLVKLLKINKDVYILCHEYNGMFCHRQLIAKYIEKHYNLPWKEF